MMPSRRLLFLIVSAALFASPVFVDSLLSNADFKQGKPGEEDLAWLLDPAKDQKSGAGREWSKR